MDPLLEHDLRVIARGLRLRPAQLRVQLAAAEAAVEASRPDRSERPKARLPLQIPRPRQPVAPLLHA